MFHISFPFFDRVLLFYMTQTLMNAKLLISTSATRKQNVPTLLARIIVLVLMDILAMAPSVKV